MESFRVRGMEKTYAEVLWQMIQRGTSPKKAVHALHETLTARGRAALMPRIARAFARIAAREGERTGMVLAVAREKDAQRAIRAAKGALASVGVKAADVHVRVDDTLIGGWRLEGREQLVDASWKKHLISIYNRVVAK